MDPLADPRQRRRLLDAVATVGSELELTAVLRRIVESATDLVGATYGAVGVLDDTGSGLREFVTVGVDDATAAQIGSSPLGHGILGVLIKDPRPLRLKDLSVHPESVGFPPHHPPMTSFLGVPIMVRGEVFGDLYLCDKDEGDQFTEVDEELAMGLAAAAGVAIDNSQLTHRVAELSRADDRERIARDLHDTVIQRLFAVGLSLQAGVRLTDRPEVVERLELAIDDLDTTIREIRSTIFELQPVHPTTRSARQAVLEVCAEATRSIGFEPAVRFDGPIDGVIDDEIAPQLLAAVREALANVARHAAASRVEVRLSAGEEVTLVVTDDGVGVPPPPSPGGRGLVNLRTRAVELGGGCAVGPGPDGGTVLRWSVPVR